MSLKTLTPLLLLSTLLPLSPATAQLIPDQTLGTEASTVNPTTLDGLPTDLIEGGATRGQHLFHSFREFNVNEAQRVYFANPVGIENILSRVTGNNISHILGTLGVNGNANLYLINPNGIIFGENATLDIRGSFTATTVESILFDNYEFSATNPDAPPLLTLNITPGIQYPENYQRSIINQGNLTVGEDLTLVSNTVETQGQFHSGGNLTVIGTETVKIQDSLENPVILSAGEHLLVQGNNNIDIFALNHPDSGLIAGGNLTLRSANAVSGDAHFWSGGTFKIEQLDGSVGDLYSPNDPIVFAVGDVTIGNYALGGASLHVLAGGSVTIGDVIIDAFGTDPGTIHPNHSDPFIAQLAQYNLSDGTPVTVNGKDYYTLDIRAGIDWNQLGGLPVSLQNQEVPAGSVATTYSNPATNANITIGQIVTAIEPPVGIGKGGHIFLTNRYFPNNLLGDITVNGDIIVSDIAAGGLVYMDSRNNLTTNGNQIRASARTYPLFGITELQGNGGDIRLLSNNQLNIQSELLADGLLGGNITIGSNQNITLNQSVFSNNYSNTLTAKGGSITITTPRTFTLQNGAQLSTLTSGSATAGNITVNAEAINIKNPANVMSDTGIFANTNGTGDAGTITLNSGDITLDNGFLFANTARLSDSPTPVLGNGGQITVNGNNLTLNNGSFFSTASQSEGRAGNIQVNTNSTVNLVGTNDKGLPSGFIFGGFNSGDAGQLGINTRNLLISDGALISGTAYGSGKAGDITVNAWESVTVEGSGINAPSGLVYETGGTGNAGNFTLRTGALNILDGGNVSAQSIGTGNAGTFTVDARDILIQGESGRFKSRLFFDSANAGNAGQLQVNTERLRVENGGRVAGTTRGSGQGGFLGVNATESLWVDGSGSGLFFESLGSGDARGIEVITGDLTVQNGGEITVSGEGTGRAGDLNIDAGSVFLNQQGNLTARTVSGEGGNINLQVEENLLLRYNSNILTEALGTGNGGNITITAGGFVIAVLSENSDIAATAIQGRGGNIFVTAKGIFGFSNPGRLVRTPESDLSASSFLGIDGTVDLDVGSYQPEIPLSDRFAPPSLGTRCRPAGQTRSTETERSEFYVTGGGGLPSSPSEVLGGGSVYIPWEIGGKEEQFSEVEGSVTPDEDVSHCYPLFYFR